MRYRKLGNTGVSVSEVSLGNWLTQGNTVDQAGTDALVELAREHGVNLFDTADVYQGGRAEELLGVALKDVPRHEVVIATKCYFPFSDDVNDRGLSRKHIFESLHRSLKRLDTDYVDLMQCHRWDSETPLAETVRALGDLIRQGKTLYWGVSQWSSDQIAEACLLADQLGVPRPVSNQPPYNLVERTIEDRVIPTSERLGLAQIVYSPLAQGLLTGKYLPGQPPPAGSRGADAEASGRFMQGHLQDQGTLERVQEAKRLAGGEGFDLPTVALAWCLRQHNVASVIVGASSPEQLTQNLQVAEADVPADLIGRVGDILKG